MLKFEHNIGENVTFTLTKFGDARLRNCDFVRPKIRKKWTGLTRFISINTNIDEKRFVAFEHTINHHSSGYIGLPRLR